MFYKYLISNVSDKEVLYLFLDNRYEISSEFSKDIKEDSIQNKIKSYIKKNNINVIYFNKYINLFLYHELMYMASLKKMVIFIILVLINTLLI